MIGVVIAGLILLSQLRLHIIPSNLARASFVALWLPYLILLGIFIGIALIRTPVELDNSRSHEISTGKARVAELSAEVQSLKRKPYEEAFERMVREKVERASAPAKELLRFMLDHGEMDINFVTISTGNHFAVGNECYSLGFLDERELRPGNGLVATGTYYKLKDNFHPVLRSIFYPKSS